MYRLSAWANVAQKCQMKKQMAMLYSADKAFFLML